MSKQKKNDDGIVEYLDFLGDHTIIKQNSRYVSFNKHMHWMNKFIKFITSSTMSKVKLWKA